MTMPYDGRSRPEIEYQPGAMDPEEFADAFCEALVRTSMEHSPGPGVQPGMSHEQARLFHGTYLKYMSFFAWKFPSWLMAVATQCPYQDVRREIINDCIDEEVGDADADGMCHIDVLYDEAETVGVSRDDIYATKPTAPILAACLAFENLSRQYGWLPGFAAIAGLEIINSERSIAIRKRLSSADDAARFSSRMGGKEFHEALGLPDGALKFLALHAYKDTFHGGGELKLLQKYASTRQLQEEAIWAGTAAVQIMGLQGMEVRRLAAEAAGVAFDPESFKAKVAV